MTESKKSIFHFTPEFQLLVKILESGFIPNYVEEDIRWLGFKGVPNDGHMVDSSIGIPMVCFREFILSSKVLKLREFGSFGLGLTRDWAIQNGVRPITYVAAGSDEAESYKSLGKIDKESMRNLVVFTQIVDYIDEREWRFVPQHYKVPKYLVRETMSYRAKLFKFWQSRILKYGILSFETFDIQKIVVETDEQIPALITEIERIYSDSSTEELNRILKSITSLEYLYSNCS